MSVEISDVLCADFESIDSSLIDAARNKTILVSGATGFIGSLLVRALLWANDERDLGSKIIVGLRSPEKMEKIVPGIFNRRDVKTEILDFSRPCNPAASDFDYLVHTAAITTSRVMIERPVDVLNVSINGTQWALESARIHPESKVLVLSSMEACGSFNSHTVAHENTVGSIDLESVRSCYPEGKRVGELMCLAYAKQYGVHGMTGRLAQTFGAGILPSEGRVFKQFAESALAGKPIVLHTDGMSEGNYVYSSDALSAILLLLAKGSDGETYNIANEECHTTIRAMAELVADNLGKPGCEVLVEANGSARYGYAAPTKMLLSSSKIKSLGWEPKIGLLEAYRRLITYLSEEA